MYQDGQQKPRTEKSHHPLCDVCSLAGDFIGQYRLSEIFKKYLFHGDSRGSKKY